MDLDWDIFTQRLNNIVGRWLGASVTPDGNGGANITIIPATTNDDRGDRKPPEDPTRLREEVASALSRVFNGNKPVAENGGPAESSAPKVSFHIPVSQLPVAMNLVEQSVKAANPSVTKDEKGKIVDPLPSSVVADEVEEARRTASNAPRTSYTLQKEYEAKQEARRMPEAIAGLIKSMGLPAEGEMRTTANESKFRLLNQVKNEAAALGFVKNGEIEWERMVSTPNRRVDKLVLDATERAMDVEIGKPSVAATERAYQRTEAYFASHSANAPSGHHTDSHPHFAQAPVKAAAPAKAGAVASHDKVIGHGRIRGNGINVELVETKEGVVARYQSNHNRVENAVIFATIEGKHGAPRGSKLQTLTVSHDGHVNIPSPASTPTVVAAHHGKSETHRG